MLNEMKAISLIILIVLIILVFAFFPLILETQEFNPLKFMFPLNYYLIALSIFILIRKRIFDDKEMRFGTHIIIIGFILFVSGVIGIELSFQGLHSESIHMSDIPLWIKLVNELPTHLVYVGIITTIAGIVIRRKQNTDGIMDMRK